MKRTQTPHIWPELPLRVEWSNAQQIRAHREADRCLSAALFGETSSRLRQQAATSLHSPEVGRQILSERTSFTSQQDGNGVRMTSAAKTGGSPVLQITGSHFCHRCGTSVNGPGALRGQRVSGSRGPVASYNAAQAPALRLKHPSSPHHRPVASTQHAGSIR
ncbi:MAG TPA: hypothetical protein VGF67_08265 [Ktedonobacteraceae bacterium]|jgi:hypothetical protein